jgi:8-oxo-dGTP diphosphatase
VNVGLIDVVAAALVRDGCVLAARRVRPVQLAGGWEFPGGKVEPGEDAQTALARECREELGVDVTVGTPVAVASDDVIRLTLLSATLAVGEPAAGADHDELRWLASTELESVAWLPIDRQFLPTVDLLLRDGIRKRTL